MYGLVYIHSVPCLLGQPRNNDTLVAMSTSSAQILFPKYHSQIKEPGSLEKWLIPGVGKIQDEPGTSWYARIHRNAHERMGPCQQNIEPT